MRHLILALFAISIISCKSVPETSSALAPAPSETSAEYAHHPKPTEPTMLDPVAYDRIKKKIAPPPMPGSTAQKEDEQELLKIQKSRTVEECSRAKNAVSVNLKTFFGRPDGSLEDKDVERLASFFGQLRNDADYVIHKLKVEFPRQRPYDYIAGLEPCVPKEKSKAYPSGHTAISRLYALVLSDLFPKDKKKFQDRALTIGKDRILSGMHHPSDVSSGRTLGDMLYAEFKKNDKFKSVFNELKAQTKKN